MADGSYQTLDIVTPAGATTLVTTMYLRACHPEAEVGDDPFATAARIGYPATATKVYPSFDTLTRG